MDYFATWCGPCKMMHPILDELKERLGDKSPDFEDRCRRSCQSSKCLRLSDPVCTDFDAFQKGRMLWRQSGVVRVPRLEEIIKPYLAS